MLNFIIKSLKKKEEIKKRFKEKNIYGKIKNRLGGDCMGTPILRYYVFKDSLRFIHSNITYLQDTSNLVLFKYSLFYDAEEYYKIFHCLKKDIYKISTKIKENFFPFFKECVHNAYVHASEEEKLFCYYILISNITSSYITPYIQALASSKDKKESYIEKMIETYYFNKNEKLKLHRTNLAEYFFDSFGLTATDIHLLEKPIKRQFGFFCSKNYYLECYKSARFYYDHLARSATGIKRPLFFFYDAFLNHRKGKRKARQFLYPKRLDTTILNLVKESYPLKQQEVNYSLDELYQQILKESKRACDALNNYFTMNENIKALEKYFNIRTKD